jgi:hypothetical protein
MLFEYLYTYATSLFFIFMCLLTCCIVVVRRRTWHRVVQHPQSQVQPFMLSGPGGRTFSTSSTDSGKGKGMDGRGQGFSANINNVGSNKAPVATGLTGSSSSSSSAAASSSRSDGRPRQSDSAVGGGSASSVPGMVKQPGVRRKSMFS